MIAYGKGSVFETARGLKRHQASCRPARDRSRKGTKTLRASERRKRVALAEAQQPLRMSTGGDGTEPEEIGFVFDFKYLGHWFQSDGDGMRNIEIRMAQAGSAFGRLNHIWRDKRLSKRVKLKLYATFVISILVWGLGAWKLDKKLRGKLAVWNARMLCKVNGTAPEDYGKAIPEQTHAPDFDLVAKLKARRLRWLGHVLRMPETSLLRRVVLRHGTTDLPDGTIFDDAPEHASLEELVELAGNHVTKLGKRRCAEWGMAVAKLQRGGGAGMAGLKANTPEETEAALEELGPDCVRIYTDGGGAGEHGDTAGWGAHAVRVHADGRAEVLADLWGPVETDPTSVWSIGCTRGTNNTAEVNGLDEGLELIDQRPAGNTYAILFDSMYAANVVEGNWTARTNVDAVGRTAALLVEVRRRNDVRLIHVKGHSADGGNDRADELAWWGKEGPPFCRLRPRGGEGASRLGPAANYEARAERRAEEKAAAARAAAAVGDAVAATRAAAAMGGAADVAQGGVGGATLGTSAADDVAGVAWGATENAVCDGVGQLSDPLEGHVI